MDRDDQPGPRTNLHRRLGLALAILLAFLFLAGTYAAPWLDAKGSLAGRWLHGLYGPVCHQMPERCLPVLGGVQAVCARCAGLYVGGLLGIVLFAPIVTRRAVRVRPIWLAAALAPTVLDVVLPWLGGPGLSNVPRFWISLPGGFVAGAFLAIGLADLLTQVSRFRPFAAVPVEENDG